MKFSANRLGKKSAGSLITAGFIFNCFLFSAGFSDVNIERAPISMGTNMEFGAIAAGRYLQGTDILAANKQPITRLGVGFKESYTIDQKIRINLGIGGLFWWGFPNHLSVADENLTRFGPGLSEISATYFLTQAGEQTSWIKLGFFGVKYNNDAANLGEYLFRSVPYPSLLKTGGWVIINSSGYMSQGMQFHFENLGGALTHDFYLHMERDNSPMSDVSPGYVTTFKAGIFEFGGGFSWYHALPIKPSFLRPSDANDAESQVAKFDNFPLAWAGDDTVHLGGPLSGNKPGFESVTDDGENGFIDNWEVLETDPTVFIRDTDPGFDASLYKGVSFETSPYLRKLWRHNVTGELISITHPGWDPNLYTETGQWEYHRDDYAINIRGFKLMAMAAVQLGPVRVFTEAAVLGVENQHFFYEEISERIPLMFGVSFSVPYLFDHVSLQGEYFTNKFFPNTATFNESLTPVYTVGSSFNHEPYDKDDFKWSVYVSRSIVEGMTLKAQIASDHLRLPDKNFQMSAVPIFQEADQFYFATKIEFGI